jgi:hypothetical protein
MHTAQVDGLIKADEASAVPDRQREQVEIGDLVVTLHASEVEQSIAAQ